MEAKYLLQRLKEIVKIADDDPDTYLPESMTAQNGGNTTKRQPKNLTLNHFQMLVVQVQCGMI